MVVALPGKNGPEVESLRVCVKVILADDRGVVAVILRDLVPGVVLLPVQRIECSAAALVTGEARHDRGAARSADRVHGKDITEEHAFFCQPVDVRGGCGLFQDPAIRADSMCGMVIGHDEEDVRARFVYCSSGVGGYGKSRNRHQRQQDEQL